MSARSRIAVAAVVVGAAAFALIVALALDPARAARSYLFAWSALVLAAVGALGWLLLDHALGAAWPRAVRPVAQLVATALVPLAIAFVPLAPLASHVWPWVAPSPGLAAAIAEKRGWLSLPWFIARTIGYFAVWIAAAELVRRHPDRARALASVLLFPVGVAASFAAVDWWMSLDPTWTSSAFGLYAITGALTSGLSAVILVGWRRRRALGLAPQHAHALGRVLLVFVLAWGYVAYLQAFLIQIADRPDEVGFFRARTQDGWRTVTAVLVAMHLALPMPMLVPRRFKQHLGYVAAIAALLLAAHVVDVYWLVIPPREPAPAWSDAVALVALTGFAGGFMALRARRRG